ncbi:ABC transporter-related protein [Cavenderia fasciculata]|uniref:ABC transporter-related protein n=1 Tax=Cavenderia fasciculata TaxID=261658 RepID=F4PMC9_CACFS|nr:ABC transporter-related protein [Cavenderia fasciculata]EGG22779.1 ABC transporter-related protein [Cavenderia fasciculata]|eukprot:XP_004360630.1 ABC transporter-related protein [Cavenderia fasciculata]
MIRLNQSINLTKRLISSSSVSSSVSTKFSGSGLSQSYVRDTNIQYEYNIDNRIVKNNNNNNNNNNILKSNTPLYIDRNTIKSTTKYNYSSKKGGPINKQGVGNERVALSLVSVQKKLEDGRVLLKETSLSFFDGSKIGLLGSNGSGKSTLMKILAGEDTEIDGEVLITKGLSIGYLAQEPELDHDKDVEGNIFDGLSEEKAILDEYDEITDRLDEEELSDAERKKLLVDHKRLQNKIDKEKLWDLKRKIAISIDALNCPPGDSSVDTLSGGERRRVALARLLIANPDILLLDEPTNHLDAESVAWLERFLKEYRGTVVAITHDRYFLDNVAGWILEVDRGSLIPFKGNYSAWLAQKESRLVAETKKEEARKKALKRELEYLRQGAKAQTKKNNARITKYNELVSSAPEKYREPGRIAIPPCPRLGNLVIEAKGLTHEFDGRTLFENLSFNVPPGSIVGIIGPNGSGKSTLFRLLTGDLKPETGTIKIGETVRMGHVAQSRASLEDGRTIFEEVADGSDYISMGGYQVHVREYLSQFNFKGVEQDKYIGSLSGGERNRVHIAKMIKRGCNVLLLDEPTNDLDVDVLRNLENSLEDFPGCAVVISHDRYFLDRLCTHIIAFEGGSKVHVFEGNYTEYDEDRTRRYGKRSDASSKKFKRIL